NVKVTAGVITDVPPLRGIPEPTLTDFLMHDAIINPGCSGGPPCDRAGLIVGVNTAILRESRYSLAVTPEKAAKFLTGGVPDLQLKHSMEVTNKDWRDVVETVRASTVQILVFNKPDRYSPVIDTTSAIQR